VIEQEARPPSSQHCWFRPSWQGGNSTNGGGRCKPLTVNRLPTPFAPPTAAFNYASQLSAATRGRKPRCGKAEGGPGGAGSAWRTEPAKRIGSGPDWRPGRQPAAGGGNARSLSKLRALGAGCARLVRPGAFAGREGRGRGACYCNRRPAC